MRTYYVDLTQDQYIIIRGQEGPTFQIGSEDSSGESENGEQNGRFIVTPAIQRRKRTRSSASTSSSDNELVMVVEAELHNTTTE